MGGTVCRPAFDGPTVQALLREHGIRATVLARAAGLSYSTVVHILNGSHPAGWYAVARIKRAIRALGVEEPEAISA